MGQQRLLSATAVLPRWHGTTAVRCQHGKWSVPTAGQGWLRAAGDGDEQSILTW